MAFVEKVVANAKPNKDFTILSDESNPKASVLSNSNFFRARSTTT